LDKFELLVVIKMNHLSFYKLADFNEMSNVSKNKKSREDLNY
jgi:hypothetical protein